MKCGFEHTYALELPGYHLPGRPDTVPAPRLLFWNDTLARRLGLETEGGDLAEVFSGNRLPDDAQPIAQAYAGHQFGNFSRQLGDGRALLLGELLDRSGRRFDVALKGSGPTDFSRGGDGKAAVGPMLREVLIGEFLHAAGIPTSRALAVVATGEEVRRSTMLPGAVLTRVASSHIRVGSFEFYAARGDVARVRTLADYAIARHDPDLVGREDRYLEFLRAVSLRQADLVARWMDVGFIHGVLNTDNVAVSGESIDFGPCAFLEAYDPGTVFSSIDHEGRYAFGNQPAIVQWNLARLAEAMIPFLDPEPSRALVAATRIVEAVPGRIRERMLENRLAKLGLPGAAASAEESDRNLIDDWLGLLHAHRVDFTLAWRHLAWAAEGDEAPLLSLFADREAPVAWLGRWRERCAREDAEIDAAAESPARLRARRIREANPAAIPRNHLVEEALAAASDSGDMGSFDALLEALRSPFDGRWDDTRFASGAAPETTARYRTFCGT